MIDFPDAVRLNPSLTDGAKLLYYEICVIYKKCNVYHYTTREELGRVLNKSKIGISRALKELFDHHFIEYKGARGSRIIIPKAASGQTGAISPALVDFWRGIKK